MATVKKEKVIHVDKLGQPLELGMHVAACHRNTMYVCKIVKVSPVMIRVLDVKSKPNSYHDEGWLVYPHETVILSGPDALAYILKYA